MSDKNHHLKIVAQNHEVLEHLSQPDCSAFTDWSVTIIFYMALHFVHAYLAQRDNKHPGSHTELDNIIGRMHELRPIHHKYRHLKDDSWHARYAGTRLPVYSMRNDCLKCYQELQDYLFKLLSIDESKKYDLYQLFPLAGKNQ